MNPYELAMYRQQADDYAMQGRFEDYDMLHELLDDAERVGYATEDIEDANANLESERDDLRQTIEDLRQTIRDAIDGLQDAQHLIGVNDHEAAYGDVGTVISKLEAVL